jgi:hypothetical protein
MIARYPRFPAPRFLAPYCAAPPMLVGARHAVPVFPCATTPTLNLTPLYATLTKKRGCLFNARRASTSVVGAQFIAPFSLSLPIQPRATNASRPSRGPTPTASLTPLNATLTKTRGGAC